MNTFKNSRLIETNNGQYVTAIVGTKGDGTNEITVGLSVFFRGNGSHNHRLPLPVGYGVEEWLEALTPENATAFYEMARLRLGVERKRIRLVDIGRDEATHKDLMDIINDLPAPFYLDAKRYVDLSVLFAAQCPPEDEIMNGAKISTQEMKQFILAAAKDGYTEQDATNYLRDTFGINFGGDPVTDLLRQIGILPPEEVPPPQRELPEGADENKIISFPGSSAPKPPTKH